VLFAQVKSPVRDRMRRTGLLAMVGEGPRSTSVGSAVTDFLRRWPPDPDQVTDPATLQAASPGS
jgi:hypothetical protein